MCKKPILVILAAGMGSRYGGLKQIDAVGPNGEILMDYSLFDAYRAGFRRVVFIIREDFASEFEQRIGNKWREHFEVQYAFQKMMDIPAPYELKIEREKPLGTAHALWSARQFLDAPFGVLNADDYYGPSAFSLLYDFLSNYHQTGRVQGLMVAYAAGNTLSRYGTVARGVCRVKQGKLKSIQERKGIKLSDDGEHITFIDSPEEILTKDTPVSMNCWGLGSEFIDLVKEGFDQFFNEVLAMDPLKGEFLLPTVIGDNIDGKKMEVDVVNCTEHWFGVTYREDKPLVQEALKQKAELGIYPANLW